MDKDYLLKKAREFDSDNNKKEELATFLRMYSSIFANDSESILQLKVNIEGLSAYFIKIELKFGKSKLKTIKDFVLIEKFFWMIDLLHRKDPNIDLKELSRYVKIIHALEEQQLVCLFVDYLNLGKKHFSSTGQDLLECSFASIGKFETRVFGEPDTLSDIVEMAMAKLSYAYYAIIETPKMRDLIEKYTSEYANLVDEILNNKCNNICLKEYAPYGDDILSRKPYYEIYSVIYSPESILVIMNNYRRAKEESKIKAENLLLKIADGQCKFIFEKRICIYDYEKSASELCESIFDVIDKKLSDTDLFIDEGKIIPSIPFYNINYFATRVGKQDLEEAKLIVGIDWLNDAVRYSESASLAYDIFVDEVLTSTEESMRKNGVKINTEYDRDVYAAIDQILGKDCSSDIVQYRGQYENNEDLKYKYISQELTFYLLGIFLRTLYALADLIKGEEGNFPFKIYRDKVLNLLFDAKSYGKADGLFARYGSDKLNLIEERAYSEIKTEIMSELDRKLDEVNSYDELMRADLKSLYSKFWLLLGTDDFFLTEIENIDSKIRSVLELSVKAAPEYQELYSSLLKKYGDSMTLIETRLNDYLSNDMTTISGKIKKVIASLATGEFLYQQYVKKDEVPEIDFSGIAIEYYTSLELLVNIAFYIPYVQKVLKPKCEEIQKNNLESFENELRGYIGTSKAGYILDKNHLPKESLEIGTISNLYMNLLKSNGTVQNSSVKIAEYLDVLSIDKIRARNIFKHLNHVKELRNEAAHGGTILPNEKAKKAQDVTYIHTPNPDPDINIDDKCIAVTCHNLISEIFELFVLVR